MNYESTLGISIAKYKFSKNTNEEKGRYMLETIGKVLIRYAINLFIYKIL